MRLSISGQPTNSAETNTVKNSLSWRAELKVQSEGAEPPLVVSAIGKTQDLHAYLAWKIEQVTSVRLAHIPA